MSQENVEVVRRMYDAYARGDFATGLSYLDSGIEFSQPAEEPGGGTYHGHDERPSDRSDLFPRS